MSKIGKADGRAAAREPQAGPPPTGGAPLLQIFQQGVPDVEDAGGGQEELLPRLSQLHRGGAQHELDAQLPLQLVELSAERLLGDEQLPAALRMLPAR